MYVPRIGPSILVFPKIPSWVPSCSYFVFLMCLPFCLLCIMLTTLHYLRQILIGALLLTSSTLNSASWLIGTGRMNFLWMSKIRLRLFSQIGSFVITAAPLTSDRILVQFTVNGKFLWLLLYSKLTFREHIGVMCNKLSKIIFLFFISWRNFSRESYY